jgi:hypothetical protein
MAVNIGNNFFFGVPFPVVVADLFFNIYPAGKRFSVDIFRWDDKAKTATYEVKASQPLKENIESNPTGIVTVADDAGTFLFKFRPKPGVSQIFGKIPATGEIEVRVSDRSITVTREGKPMATLERNQFSGMPIGVQVFADGGLAIGVNALPEGMRLVKAS